MPNTTHSDKDEKITALPSNESYFDDDEKSAAKAAPVKKKKAVGAAAAANSVKKPSGDKNTAASSDKSEIKKLTAEIMEVIKQKLENMSPKDLTSIRKSAGHLRNIKQDSNKQYLILPNYNQAFKSIMSFLHVLGTTNLLQLKLFKGNREGTLEFLSIDGKLNLLSAFNELLSAVRGFKSVKKTEIRDNVDFETLKKLVNSKLPKDKIELKNIRSKVLPLAASLVMGNNFLATNVTTMKKSIKETLDTLGISDVFDIDYSYKDIGKGHHGRIKFSPAERFQWLQQILNMVLDFPEQGLQPIAHKELNQEFKSIIDVNMDAKDSDIVGLKKTARDCYLRARGGNKYFVGNTNNAILTIGSFLTTIGLKLKFKIQGERSGNGNKGKITIEPFDQWRSLLNYIINHGEQHALGSDTAASIEAVSDATSSSSSSSASAARPNNKRKADNDSDSDDVQLATKRKKDKIDNKPSSSAFASSSSSSVAAPPNRRIPRKDAATAVASSSSSSHAAAIDQKKTDSATKIINVRHVKPNTGASSKKPTSYSKRYPGSKSAASSDHVLASQSSSSSSSSAAAAATTSVVSKPRAKLISATTVSASAASSSSSASSNKRKADTELPVAQNEAKPIASAAAASSLGEVNTTKRMRTEMPAKQIVNTPPAIDNEDVDILAIDNPKHLAAIAKAKPNDEKNPELVRLIKESRMLAAASSSSSSSLVAATDQKKVDAKETAEKTQLMQDEVILVLEKRVRDYGHLPSVDDICFAAIKEKYPSIFTQYYADYIVNKFDDLLQDLISKAKKAGEIYGKQLADAKEQFPDIVLAEHQQNYGNHALIYFREAAEKVVSEQNERHKQELHAKYGLGQYSAAALVQQFGMHNSKDSEAKAANAAIPNGSSPPRLDRG